MEVASDLNNQRFYKEKEGSASRARVQEGSSVHHSAPLVHQLEAPRRLDVTPNQVLKRPFWEPKYPRSCGDIFS